MEQTSLLLAHGVGRVYELPVPLGFYLGGAALTVIVSFAIRALRPGDGTLRAPRPVAGSGFASFLRRFLQVVSIVLVVFCLVAAVVTREEGLTTATLLFWVWLVVGFAALSAVVAGVWPPADPWGALERVYLIGEREEREPPWWLGPLMLFVLFWFELVSGRAFEDSGIVVAVIAYTLYTTTIRSRYGPAFVRADPLYILFGFASGVAPLELRRESVDYRGFQRGLAIDEPMSLALFASLFVLLGSTTLDNVRETVGWTSLRGDLGLANVPDLLIDTLALALFGSLFFALLSATLYLAKRTLRTESGFLDVARRFGWSLVPIGVTYLLAHNAPLLMTGVPQLIASASDPFLMGWDLFGTAGLVAAPAPELVWFIEIALIVAGHILGVLLAHRTAARLAPSARGAVASQYALTALMAALTITTLWLLSQPLVD